MTVKLYNYDISEQLKTEKDMKYYLEVAFLDGDPRLIKACIKDVLKSRNMTALAKETGISRAGLYKMLSENGNPEFVSILKILKALNLELTVR